MKLESVWVCTCEKMCFMYTQVASYSAFCVFQLIARLKNEVLVLREELAMVTGEQRDEKLSAEEIWKYAPSFCLLYHPFNPVSLS